MAAGNSPWTPHALLGSARARPTFRAAAPLQAQAPRFVPTTVREAQIAPASGSPAAASAAHHPGPEADGRAQAVPGNVAAAPAAPASPGHPATAPAEGVDLQSLLEQRWAEGHAEGLRQARSARAPAAAASGEAVALLQAVRAQLDALSRSPARHFEPLKRLALHLAHQLVQVELTVSAQAIDGLIARCTEALGDAHGEVVIELHPDDLALLGPLDPGGLPGPAFKADAALSRGSVRVHGEHADVEDLIEHRLGLLARELKLDDARWRSGVAAVAAVAARATQAAASGAAGPVTPRVGPDALLHDAQDVAFRMTDAPPPADPEPEPDPRA